MGRCLKKPVPPNGPSFKYSRSAKEFSVSVSKWGLDGWHRARFSSLQTIPKKAASGIILEVVLTP